MAYAVKLQGPNRDYVFISTEQLENYAILRAFQAMIPEIGEDYDDNNRAQDNLANWDLEKIKEFSFYQDVRSYRSAVAFKAIKEITFEEQKIYLDNAEFLGLYE